MLWPEHDREAALRNVRQALARMRQAIGDQLLKALRLLEVDEQHLSLRVHKLHGELAGIWSATASSVQRLTFLRLKNGRKRLLTCSRHYDQ